MEEIWKDVKDYEGIYLVSNIGNVKSIDRKYFNGKWWTSCKGKKLLQHNDKYGYKVLAISKQGKMKLVKAHRLVAIAFISNPENKPQVNHLDGNKENNTVENLQWCDGFENMRHAHKNGLVDIKKGNLNHRTKITDEKLKALVRLFRIYPNTDKKKLSDKLKVKYQTIYSIYSNKNKRLKNLNQN